MSKIVDQITENIREMSKIVDRIDQEADDMREFLAKVKNDNEPLSRPEARIFYFSDGLMSTKLKR